MLVIRIRPPARQRKTENISRETINTKNSITIIVIHRVFKTTTLLALVPGSNRSYNNVGSSRYIAVDIANPVHDQKRDSFVSLH
ncbi:hypothetical protein F511_19899 [Dorcoceras hygrometricum]|uniref:Uncharacterized protein n=1 Tax=Dorcoceras hygrometricum TaxID=472368 RepID=A0A2Z7AHA3_9LAMI|nr:hypothetical protein F511_19899 [Dorcoceras hygrometricum]